MFCDLKFGFWHKGTFRDDSGSTCLQVRLHFINLILTSLEPFRGSHLLVGQSPKSSRGTPDWDMIACPTVIFRFSLIWEEAQ